MRPSAVLHGDQTASQESEKVQKLVLSVRTRPQPTDVSGHISYYIRQYTSIARGAIFRPIYRKYLIDSADMTLTFI